MKNCGYIKRFTPVLAVCLMASVSAFAKNSRSLKLAYPASLSGTQIAAGQYKLVWDLHGADAKVTLMKNKSVVATTRGKWVDGRTQYRSDAVIYTTGPNGERSITEIRFAGMKQALVLSDSSSVTAIPTTHTPAEGAEGMATAQAADTGGARAKAARIRFLGKPRVKRQQPRDSGLDPAIWLPAFSTFRPRPPVSPGPDELHGRGPATW